MCESDPEAVEASENAIRSAGSFVPGIWANVADLLLLLLLSAVRSPLRRTSISAPSARRWGRLQRPASHATAGWSR